MASFAKPGETPVIVQFKSDGKLSAEEKEVRYQNLLDEAAETNMSDLESCGCVGLGCDSEQRPVLMFIPKLGFTRVDKTDATLRRMLLLFIKTADAVVKQPFSICYAHTTLSILSQMPLVHRYYKMLPRPYKKNLQKLYVLQPTQIIRVFFEMGVRWFVSEKFYRKLIFIDSIYNFQRQVPPVLCQVPHALIKLEDDDNGLKGTGVVAPLAASFDPALSTTRLIHQCCEYIRYKGLTRKGIFRISGDEVALTVVKSRVQQTSYKHDVDNTSVIIGEESGVFVYEAALAASASSSSSSSSSAIGGAFFSKGEAGEDGAGRSKPSSSEKDKAAMISAVVVTCVDTTAQVLKMLLRSLPEPLIPYDCYQPLLSVARKYQETKSEEQSRDTCTDIVACMPPQHSGTLRHLLRFLKEVQANSGENLMDDENIARIFAPTIMWSREERMQQQQQQQQQQAAGAEAGAGAGAGAAASTEALQLDLVKAATELNLCKIVVKQLLKLHSVAGAGAGAGAGDGGEDAGAGGEGGAGGPTLNAKMMSRLAGGRSGGGDSGKNT